MKTLKTVLVAVLVVVIAFAVFGLVMACRGWWNAGSGTATPTPTPTTVTVTAEPDTETETEEPESTEAEVTEAEVTETEEPESTEAAAPEDTGDLALKRDKETVESLSGQERTAVRGVLRDCMNQIGAIHYVSQIKQCLAGDMDGWSEDSARRSGEVPY